MKRLDPTVRDRLREQTIALMETPGLSGHEGRVRRRLAAMLDVFGQSHRTDRLGNLIATLDGDAAAPSVMIIAHMDQLGFVVRKVETDGFLRIERLGGTPIKALPSQAVLVQIADGRDALGAIANTAHHVTSPEDRTRVTPLSELYVDCGFRSAAEARAAGIEIGAPVVYAPQAIRLANDRLAGTSIDDRAACAVLVELMRALADAPQRPTTHAVFSVQEEFNLRGALPAAHALEPDICIQLDLGVACDTPELGHLGDVRLGGGPTISRYSFHGRGTINGLLPHPAMVDLFARSAAAIEVPLQPIVHMGALTETAYVQHVGEGVASIDLGFPCRGSHSSLEICDVGDLAALHALLTSAIPRIDAAFSLNPDDTPS